MIYPKRMRWYGFIFICFWVISCGHKNLKLLNDNYLSIADSIVIKVDSVTIVNSRSFQFKDSILMIPNEIGNSITFMGLDGKVNSYFNFDTLRKKNFEFRLDAAWFESLDSIFVYSNHKFYLFNKKQQLIDSFSTKLRSEYLKGITWSVPYVSTSQIPCISRGEIFATGCSLGENLKNLDSNRFVISAISKDTIKYYVNYPSEYQNKNWGGIYYRMVNHCTIDDSLICISFPASNQVALFNTITKKVRYVTLYPDLSSYIKPFYGDKNDKRSIASHYYRQYAFGEIIYDPFREIYYRFLLMPTTKANAQLDYFGVKKKILLVYDKNFKYLGSKKLDESISHSTYFITEKGLYLNYFKNNRDENNLYFYLLTTNNR
jgi:hypothetical protein